MAFKVSKVDPHPVCRLDARATGFRRDSHHARLLRAGGDDNDTLVPPRQHAGARDRAPLHTLRS